jgi:hypothetical protein
MHILQAVTATATATTTGACGEEGSLGTEEGKRGMRRKEQGEPRLDRRRMRRLRAWRMEGWRRRKEQGPFGKRGRFRL